MRRWIYSIFIILVITSKVAGQDIPATDERVIEIVLGIDKVEKLNFSPSSRGIQVGNESILSTVLVPQKREITFKGLKPGKTSVIIRDTVGDIKARYLVNITSTDQSKIVKEIKEFIGDVEGIEIGIKGEQVYVGGQIVVPTDIGRVATIIEKYEGVLSLVELSPQTQRVIARKMQEEIQTKGGIRDVTVRVVNNLFWLEGVVTSDADKVRAENIAAAYVPDRIEVLAKQSSRFQQAQRPIIQNFIQVNKKSQPAPIPKLIKVTAQFVELTKDYNRIFGFKWEPLLSDGQGTISFGKTTSGGVTTQSAGTLSGTISNLFPKLSSAKAAGFARVIQSGVIVIKDKVQGTISKREEKPFAIGNNEFLKSEKAVAGFDLTITPTVLQAEKIDLNLGLSVSATTGDPPQTLSNNVKTSLVVKSKESAVVGGIVVNKSSTDFDRNPPGGKSESEDSSPLFSFIRSKSYTNTRSQFVVFVTPEIIDSAATGTEEIKRKFRQRRR